MITVTPEAAEQIKLSAEQGNAMNLALRIAVKRQEDGSFHYAMGFDDRVHPGDQQVDSNGVNVVVDGASLPLAKGLMVDFVELGGNMEFVFMNPNDPSYQPPVDE